MLLGKKFQAFVDKSPVSVMVRGTLERILDQERLERLLQDHATSQYTLKITLAQCVQIMDAVVFKTQPSVGAWYKDHGHGLSATRQSLYDKLKRMEPAVSAALVHYSGVELLDCIRGMKGVPKEPLPGLRVRVLDGNCLTGTEHRLKGLRGTRAAALPGKALVFFDPRYALITDVIPCEDAYTQERALSDQALAMIVGDDCVIADRNFCTAKFLFGIARRQGYFIIRQHASNLPWQPMGKIRNAGKDTSGRQLREQRIRLTDPSTGNPTVVRRIIIPLRKANAKGEKALYVLTNLSRKQAAARTVAELYAERWTIENAFQQLTDDLRTEIDTLAYPKAALLAFCLACVAYNAVSLVKAALRATLGAPFVDEKLSMYYLTLEVARVTPGMDIAIPAKDWHIFRRMGTQAFVATILAVAGRIRPEKYTKHKRGPKKPPPNKSKGKRIKHVSTARILAATG
jgi:hypothetical protein